MEFNPNKSLLLFKINNLDDSKIVQQKLLENNFKWSSGSSEILRIVYPSYIMARLKDNNRELTFYAIENDEVEKEFREYIDTEYNDYYTNFFNSEDVLQLETILKIGRIRPTYKPITIERTYESFKKEYDFLFFKIENLYDFEKVRDILLNKGYLPHKRDDYIIWNMTDDDFPKYVIVDRENLIFALSEWDENWNEEDVLDYINDINKEDSNKILNKILGVSDIRNIDNLFKGIIRPSYSHRNIKRVYESNKYNTINVIIDNYSDALEFQNYLQDLGFGWHGRNEKNVIQFYNDMNFYIFTIDVKTKNIPYATFYYNPDSRIYKENISLFYPKDFNNIKSIIRFGSDKPSYKPRDIRRFESFINESNGEINELCLKINNEKEFLKAKEFINEIDYRYSSKTPVEYPHYLFFPLNSKFVSHITKDKEYLIYEPKDNPFYILGDVYEKIFNINELGLIKHILKTGRITTNLYSPKKIER
ncbi:MAG: hypothetical protein ACOC3V_03605 [bacterium]